MLHVQIALARGTARSKESVRFCTSGHSLVPNRKGAYGFSHLLL